MAHFPELFHIKIDKRKNLIRLSIRDSENKLDEHWFEKSDIESCLVFREQDTWVGENKLKFKRINKDGLIAIDIDEDSRVIYKFGLTQIQILIAQLRGASSEINHRRKRQTKSKKKTASRAKSESYYGPSITHADLENLKNQILNEIKELFKTNTLQINENVIENKPALEDDKPQLAEPMFIPSDLVREDIKGNIKTKEQKSKSGDVADALKALKRRKKK